MIVDMGALTFWGFGRGEIREEYKKNQEDQWTIVYSARREFYKDLVTLVIS